MNSLIVLPEEISSGGHAVLVGARAIYAFETHGLRAGTTVKCGIFGGKLGDATVTDSSRDEVRLDVSCKSDPPARLGVKFFIAIPRPQTVKKVIQGAAMAGIDEVRFMRTERCEKSYLQSKSISDSEIQRQIILGLEQVGDTIPPRIVVDDLFHECLDRYSVQEGARSDFKVIADPRGSALDLGLAKQNAGKVTFLIGPELGWSVSEIRYAENHGFVPARVGERAVRVEIAMTYLVGILEYVRGR